MQNTGGLRLANLLHTDSTIKNLCLKGNELTNQVSKAFLFISLQNPNLVSVNLEDNSVDFKHLKDLDSQLKKNAHRKSACKIAQLVNRV